MDIFAILGPFRRADAGIGIKNVKRKIGIQLNGIAAREEASADALRLCFGIEFSRDGIAHSFAACQERGHTASLKQGGRAANMIDMHVADKSRFDMRDILRAKKRQRRSFEDCVAIEINFAKIDKIVFAGRSLKENAIALPDIEIENLQC